MQQLKALLHSDLEDKAVKEATKGANTYFFGDNRQGKCGVGSEKLYAEKPGALFAKFKKIFCGYHHSAALDENKVLYMWGRGRFGQLGQGEEILQANVPSLVKGVLQYVKIDLVACGWQHTLATTKNGFLFSWGLNSNGQLGHGDFVDRFYPAQVLSLAN